MSIPEAGPPGGCQRHRFLWLVSLIFGLLVGPGLLLAQDIQTPPIEATFTASSEAVLVEWEDPPSSQISSLVLVDTSWGGTAVFEVSGEYDGYCDMDIAFRTTNSVSPFTDPYVAGVSFQDTDPSRPSYFTGTSVPSAGGMPDVCEDHNIQLVALDSDTILASGTASGNPIRFFWLDVPDTGTVILPGDYAPATDSIPIHLGVWVAFGEGSVNEDDELIVNVRSRDVQLAWDYVLHGGEETDRVSSSDVGEEEITICRPNEWVDFRFGLSIRITVDTLWEEVTEIVERDSIEPGGDTTTVYDTLTTLVPEIVGDVPSGGDSLGVISVLYRRIDGYRIYRSDITNPNRFVLLHEYNYCHEEDLPFLLSSPKRYRDDEGVHDGFPYVYYVTAYDTLMQSESPTPDSVRSGAILPRSHATEDLSKITVVPNPYKRNAAWEGSGDEKIQFTNLPLRATIRVYTVAGDLVKEWDHYDATGGGSSDWNTRNDDGDLVVSGIYLYHVKSAAGGDRVGKFIIIR